MRKMFACIVFFLGMIVPYAVSAAPITFTDVTVFDDRPVTYDELGNATNDLDGYNIDGSSVKMLEFSGDYIAWTHHFVFNPPVQDIVSGTLIVYLRDDSSDPWYAPFEFAFGFSDSGQWAFGEVNTAVYNYNVNISYLMDGSFSIYLQSLCGDFYIDRSELEITYNPVDSSSTPVSSIPIPEPATLILLGCGLIGISGIRMKNG